MLLSNYQSRLKPTMHFNFNQPLDSLLCFSSMQPDRYWLCVVVKQSWLSLSQNHLSSVFDSNAI